MDEMFCFVLFCFVFHVLRGCKGDANVAIEGINAQIVWSEIQTLKDLFQGEVFSIAKDHNLLQIVSTNINTIRRK